MRRLTSTLIGAAVAAASVLSVASPASAAPGDVTETAITNAVPASPAGMRPYRVIRLSRTGEFLVVGRVPGNGTGYHMWQLKPDLSLDTSFGTGGVVDLGVADTTPCNVGNNTVTCSSINSLTYNEVSNTYFVTIYTSVKTTSAPASPAFCSTSATASRARTRVKSRRRTLWLGNWRSAARTTR